VPYTWQRMEMLGNTGWLTAAEFEANPTMPAGTDVDTWYGVWTDSAGCVQMLFLAGNNLTNSIPPEIGGLNHLVTLDFFPNNLSGNIPPEMGNLTSLTYLNLSDNDFTDSIPPELGNLSNLIYLSIYNNNLSGELPPELGNLSNLEYLNLAFNALTGSIPPELGNMTSLEHLRLGNNEFTGDIPPELGNLGNLWALFLGDNKLSGSIPPELGNLTRAIGVDLHANELTGTIPPEFGDLGDSIIFSLRVSDNQLGGCYDDDFTHLCQFVLLDNGAISEGNNFDASWQDFCATAAGACIVDIDNTRQNTFTVYPVPAKDFVVFDVPDITLADEIILYDINGREVSRQAFPQDKRLVVSNLNDGVYIYRILYKDEIYNGKIVVE